jgi:hypothetical protein
MIRPTAELLAAVAVFDDSREISDALDRISEGDSIQANSPEEYYLKEAALHINAMHDLLRDMARALAVKYPNEDH